MKYLKKFEIVDYKKISIEDLPDVYQGNYYIYSDEPLTLDKLKKRDEYIRTEFHNRADASDTTSEYIYQIRTKYPIYKRTMDNFFGEVPDSVDGIKIISDEEKKDKKDKKETQNFSGYYEKAWITNELVAFINTKDIIHFKNIGGFVKYDKDKPKKIKSKLSEKTNDFLYSYISGTILHKKLTDDIKEELKKFRPKDENGKLKEIKIYKGLEEVQIKHWSSTKPPYKKGQIIESEIPHLSSWTKNILIARRFIEDYPSSPPFVAVMTAKPEDILVDVTLLPKQYYHTNQREIIMLPGKYTFKLIWEDEEFESYYEKMKYIKKFNENLEEDKYEIKYEEWKWKGYSKGYMSYHLYKNGTPIAGISNTNRDKKNILIRHIKSEEKGMATKLIFMLLDMGISIETGKPNFNSCSTSAYYMNKKIVDIINKSNGKYKYTILGKAENLGKENDERYKDVSGENTKPDNYHYKFEKIKNTK